MEFKKHICLNKLKKRLVYIKKNMSISDSENELKNPTLYLTIIEEKNSKFGRTPL